MKPFVTMSLPLNLMSRLRVCGAVALVVACSSSCTALGRLGVERSAPHKSSEQASRSTLSTSTPAPEDLVQFTPINGSGGEPPKCSPLASNVVQSPQGSLKRGNDSNEITLVESTATMRMNADQCVPDMRLCPTQTRVEELSQRINALEEQLQSQHDDIVSLKSSLSMSHQTIHQLNEKLTIWKGKVQSLESSMQDQHQSDIDALETITRSLESIVGDTALNASRGAIQ